MASYHFRIKSDKKSDGSRVSASVHLDYINREGIYKEDVPAPKNLETNLITFAGEKNFGDESFPLYLSDDFGKIYNTPKGLQVNGKYSTTTLAIALSLADKISEHKPIILQGSQRFKNKVIKAAVDSELTLLFADSLLQKKFEKESEERKTNPKKFYSSAKNFLPVKKDVAEQSAETILQNLEKLKIQVSAVSHFEYINREKKFASRGDCIFTSHHLPKWANDNPKNFFKAADKYEGKNRRRYVEIEFSLPNELTSVEDYKKIIEPFIDRHLKDHYYTYAIHDKLGAFSGERHPHVHIMFSERLIDDVEKIQEREPQNFFKYPARKKTDGTEPSFAEKVNLGAPKNKIWNQNSKYIFQLREDFAKIQNEVLAEKGFSVRVDHRSLKAQKMDAEQSGDSFLAEILNRPPEKYLSPVPLDDENPKVQQLKSSRAVWQNHAEKIFNDNFVLQKADEEKVLKKTLADIFLSNSFFASEVFNNDTDTEKINSYKNFCLALNQEISALRRRFISVHDAEEKAKREYLSDSELLLWQNFHDTKAQRDNLQLFLDNFAEPSYKSKFNLRTYQQIISDTKEKIKTLDSFLLNSQPAFDSLQKKLNQPSVRKNILLATHNILQQNNLVRQNLSAKTQLLLSATEKLREELLFTDKPKEIFSLHDVVAILSKHFFALKKDQEKLSALRNSASKKIISLPRAFAMAENIFVNGDFKKLREEKRKYEKNVGCFKKKFSNFQQREFDFKNTNWENSAEKLQEQYYLTKEKITLESEQKKLQSTKNFLESESSRLQNLCHSSAALQKISLITAGILRKNKKISCQISSLNSQLKSIDSQLNLLRHQFWALKKISPREFDSPVRPKLFFKLRDYSKQNNLTAASVIANALLADSKAIPLVARVNEDGLEMPMNWNLLSELKKAAIKSDVSRLV